MSGRSAPDQIEITPAMIEAGAERLVESGFLGADYLVFGIDDSIRLLISQILMSAMHGALPRMLSSSQHPRV